MRTAPNETGKVAKTKTILTLTSKDFNDSLAIDLAEWADPIANQKMLLLHMIIEFSCYSVVTVVESKEPVIFMENIVAEWLIRFGTSVSILNVVAGEFKKDLIILIMSTFGCIVKTKAGCAPFPNWKGTMGSLKE